MAKIEPKCDAAARRAQKKQCAVMYSRGYSGGWKKEFVVYVWKTNPKRVAVMT